MVRLLLNTDHHGREILDDRYVVTERIGKGGHGTVDRAFDRISARTVAIKRSRHRHFDELLRKEALLLMDHVRPHPSIIHPLDIGESAGLSYVVMPFAGELTLEDCRPMPDDRLQPIVRSIAQGLAWLHSHCVVHNDIKPDNIILSSRMTPKIADFGLSSHLKMRSNGLIDKASLGTWDFMSPERFHRLRHDARRSDVYSLGMTTIMMMQTGDRFSEVDTHPDVWAKILRNPEDTLEGQDVLRALKQAITWTHERQEPLSRYLDSMDGKVPPALLSFLRSSLAWSWKQRPTMEQVTQHEWILDIIPPELISSMSHVSIDSSQESIPTPTSSWNPAAESPSKRKRLEETEETDLEAIEMSKPFSKRQRSQE